MKSKTILISTTLLLSTLIVRGQLSGNSVIGQYYTSSQTDKPQTVSKLYLSDSAFVIQANVLANVVADSYVATFGVSDTSKTLKVANTNIDERIQKFNAALIKMGIAQADIFVDMTTQTQISDYKINGDYSEQYVCGYEQKKNVIVKFKDIKDLDKMVVIASNYGIYDLAKVDYVVTDMNKTYTQLFTSAMEVINGKKDLYILATNTKLKTTSEIYGESYYSFYPSQLYKNYTPNITTEYYDYNSYGKRKDLMKSTTYYYDKVNYSGFDKILNPVVTEPTVEFVLTLQIKFDIDKGKVK